MIVIQYQIQRDSNIFLIGDRHIGNATRDTDAWEKLVEMVHSEYDGLPPNRNYIVDHGDVIEGISSDDPRFQAEAHKDPVIKEVEYAIEDNKRTAAKTIVQLQGNHEQKWHRFGDLAEYMCKQSGIQYGTYSCIIVYHDANGNYLFRHHAHHGFGQIRSNAKDPDQELANKLAALKMKLKGLAGNCLVQSMGHTHQLLVNKPKEQLLEMESNGKIKREYATAKKRDGYIHPDFRWYINTGSFTRIYSDDPISGYVERRGYKPTDTGCAVVKVRGGSVYDIDEIKFT